jgi:hypothetical protein
LDVQKRRSAYLDLYAVVRRGADGMQVGVDELSGIGVRVCEIVHKLNSFGYVIVVDYQGGRSVDCLIYLWLWWAALSLLINRRHKGMALRLHQSLF